MRGLTCSRTSKRVIMSNFWACWGLVEGDDDEDGEGEGGGRSASSVVFSYLNRPDWRWE